MSYERRVDRDHPAFLVFLIDQSDSMEEPLGNSTATKRDAVADMLNGILYELVMRSVKSPQEGPRPYFAAAVVGYGTAPDGEPLVGSVLPATADSRQLWWTSDLAKSPLRVDRKPSPDGGGQVTSPIWMEPASRGGTPMCGALNHAGWLAKTWIDSYPDSFPPIVINLTDGEATDGDPRVWAGRLRRLSSNDGNLLLFNLNLSSQASTPLLFPAAAASLPSAEAERLFEMSSVLPPFMVDAARAQGVPAAEGARGFGFNADMRAVVTFLNVGTSVGRVIR